MLVEGWDKLKEIVVTWRGYFISLLVLVAGLVYVRLELLPALDSEVKVTPLTSLSQIIDSLIGVTASTVILMLFVAFFFPKRQLELGAMDLLSPSLIARHLKELLDNASRWSYRGHTGRYFRNKVFPELKKRARSAGGPTNISLELLDPRDITTISSFVVYRKDISPTRHAKWTNETAKIEVLATILLVATEAARTTNLEAKIYLRSSLSAFTTDLSDSGCVITREKANQDAIFFSSRSTFYGSVMEDLQLSSKACSLLTLNDLTITTLLDLKSIDAALRQLGLRDVLDPVLDKQLLKTIKKTKDPYA